MSDRTSPEVSGGAALGPSRVTVGLMPDPVNFPLDVPLLLRIYQSGADGVADQVSLAVQV